MNSRELLGGLYRVHSSMVLHSAVWGLLTGMVIVFMCRQSQWSLSLTEATLLCIGFGILAWLFSLVVPLSFPIYKYLLPLVLPLLGIVLSGIAGMIIAYAFSFILRIVGDMRMFVFIVKSTERRPDSSVFNPLRDIILRPSISFLVACGVLGHFLSSNGVNWLDVGTGDFVAIVDTSQAEILAQLPMFCLVWNLIRQGCESGIDIWTTPGLLSRK